MGQLADFMSVLLGYVPAVMVAAPLIAFVIDQAKRFGLPDGYAPLVSGLLNLAAYAALYFAGAEHQGDVETVIEAITMIAPIVVALFTSALASNAAHNLLMWAGLGYSHNGQE